MTCSSLRPANFGTSVVANLGDFDECPEVGLGEAGEAWSEDGLSMLHVVPDVPDFHLPAFPSPTTLHQK